MNPLVNKLADWAVRNAPKILTTIGVCGVIGTSVMAVKATPEAIRRKDKAIAELEDKDDMVEKTVAVVKACAPVYAPAIAMGGLTITSILAGQKVMSGRQAALAVAGSVAETALQDYQAKAIEKFGEAAHREIMDEVAKQRLDETPLVPADVIETGRGDTLCLDCQTGRYFRSSIEDVRQAEAEVCRLLNDEYWVPLNVFFDELGIGNDGDTSKLGETNGWWVDYGSGGPNIYFTSALKDDSIPVLVINYDTVNKFARR